MIVPDIAEYEETDSNLAQRTILNLHNEINRLKNKLEQQNIDMGLYSDSDMEIKKGLIDRINRQQERIDKAIEYINKLQENDDIEIWRENGYWAYILYILQGSDK